MTESRSLVAYGWGNDVRRASDRCIQYFYCNYAMKGVHVSKLNHML